MGSRSIHDNNVYGYTVDCGQQRIIVYTESHDGGREEYTDVLFSGVIAHHFACVLQFNILFGIAEVKPEQIIDGWREVFTRQKQYGWPIIEYQNLDELASILTQRGVTGYEISSSYGMAGWVLAGEMEIAKRAAKKLFA